METKIEAPAVEPPSIGRTGLAVSAVTRAYAGRGRSAGTVALRGMDLTVVSGEVVAVVGPSGCGKSTLLELVGGLQEPDLGRRVGRGPRRARRPARGVRVHAAARHPPPVANGGRERRPRARVPGFSPRVARRRAAPLFQRFGLVDFEHALPAELSGGMRQRVAFLRTLLAGRPVLLLDEPFAALDSITRASMQEWLGQALDAEQRTVLLVTHDVEEALFLADRVVVMSPRPGRCLAELAVDLPRPRPRRSTVADSRFVDLKDRALAALEP